MVQQNKIVQDVDGRNHERKNLVHDQIPGRFVLEYGGEAFVFSQVNDVSISGMGVLVALPLVVGDKVGLRYESDDFTVAINAEVVWVEKIHDGVYRAGIQFSNENMDDNVMLFMTLREYIDDFGESF